MSFLLLAVNQIRRVYCGPRAHAGALGVRSATIGAAAGVRDPHAATRAHDRLQRRDHAACRRDTFDLSVDEMMQIGFAIGDKNQSSIAKFGLNELLKCIFIPHKLVQRYDCRRRDARKDVEHSPPAPKQLLIQP